MCYWGEGVGLWGPFNGVLMLLLATGVIVLGAWALSRLTRRSFRDNDAWTVARERYARGEISREEFDRIKKDLS